jgi:hypothetical protein
MPRDFFDPTPEEQNVVLVNAVTLREAEKLLESCEHWKPQWCRRITRRRPRRAVTVQLQHDSAARG